MLITLFSVFSTRMESYFQKLSLELLDIILEHLEVSTLLAALRTAKFLRYPSERRLYNQVNLWTQPTGLHDSGLEDRQAAFLNTVLKNDHLAHHVVQLALRGNDFMEGDTGIDGIIGGSMKKMINLKKLAISGHSYIRHANLQSVPFNLTHLIISADTTVYTELDLPLLSILRAHPNLEELDLDFPELPSDLVEALKAEQNGLSHESGILCPNLKRFDGYNRTLRLFLPMRSIESGTTMGCWADYIHVDDLPDFWLTPALIQSYRHLLVLEILPEFDTDTLFLSTIAPYLTSLTHLRTIAKLHTLGTEGHLLESLGRMPALKSLTLRGVLMPRQLATVETAREVVRLVCDVCPDIAEIFVEGAESKEVMYYHYLKGKGLQSRLASHEVAFDSYIVWLPDSL